MLDTKRNLYKNYHRYLSRSVFVEVPGSLSDLTVSNVNAISLYDFINEILLNYGCCGSFPNFDSPVDDPLIPMSAFSNKEGNQSIDLYKAIRTVAMYNCNCEPEVDHGLNKSVINLKQLYFDLRMTVSKPLIPNKTGNVGYYKYSPKKYDKANQNVQGSNASIFLSDIVSGIAGEILDCCIKLPTCGIFVDNDKINLHMNSSSNDSSCENIFTSNLEFFTSDNLVTPVFTVNFNQNTYPELYDMSGLGLTAGNWFIKTSLTDCISTADCFTVYYVPELTNEITYIDQNYITTNIVSNSPLCSGNYNVIYNIKDSLNNVVHTVSYDQDTDPGNVNVISLGLACGDYTFESIATDCVSALNAYSNFTVINPPIAIQTNPDTGTLGVAELDGSTSTTCDTDLLANEYSWCISDNYNNLIEVTNFTNENSSISGSYITGNAKTPLVNTLSFYDDHACDDLSDANFVYFQTAPTEYYFDALTSSGGSCANPLITNYEWKVYDQDLNLLSTTNTSNSFTTIVFPNNPQTYYVVLTITSPCGVSSQVQSIDIVLQPVVADITTTPTVNANEFEYSASASNPGNCPLGIVAYYWEFLDTDGTTLLSSATTEDVTYQFVGNPSDIVFIRLTIWDGCGQSDTVTKSYEIDSVSYSVPEDIFNIVTGLKITNSNTEGEDIEISFTVQI